MADWLKNTIPGILILGAVGAILTIFLTRALAFLAEKWIQPSRNSPGGLLISLIHSPKETAEAVMGSPNSKFLTLYGILLTFLSILAVGLVDAGLSMIAVASVRTPTDGVKFFGIFGAFVSAFGFSLVYRSVKGLYELLAAYFGPSGQKHE